MTQQQFDKRKEDAKDGPHVVFATDDGNFRVYLPADPSKTYDVHVRTAVGSFDAERFLFIAKVCPSKICDTVFGFLKHVSMIFRTSYSPRRWIESIPATSPS